MKNFLIVIFMFLSMPVFAITKTIPSTFSTWEPYMKNVEERIKNNWAPPQNSQSIKAVAKFTIAKDGRLLDCKIIQSSGNKEYDKAAIKAVRFSHPFEKLPEEFKGDSVPIEFNFDYNVYNSNEGYNKSVKSNTNSH